MKEWELARYLIDAKKNIFNQDFNENVFLIEIGGNENTLEEAYNSAMVLADAISSVIGA